MKSRLQTSWLLSLSFGPTDLDWRQLFGEILRRLTGVRFLTGCHARWNEHSDFTSVSQLVHAPSGSGRHLLFRPREHPIFPRYRTTCVFLRRGFPEAALTVLTGITGSPSIYPQRGISSRNAGTGPNLAKWTFSRFGPIHRCSSYNEV